MVKNFKNLIPCVTSCFAALMKGCFNKLLGLRKDYVMEQFYSFVGGIPLFIAGVCAVIWIIKNYKNGRG